MSIVPTPWNRIAHFILLGFGIPFSLVGAVLYIVLDGNWALLFNGVLWLIIGIGLRTKGAFVQRNLEKLKRQGLCYEGSVVNIIPVHWIRIGSHITASVECIYEIRQIGHLVKSGYYLLSPFDRIENFHVKIYHDENDLGKCGIELFRKDNELLS